MFVGMLGCPCSGKTTTAAQVFFCLKQLGLSVEFVAEEARYYISREKNRFPTRPVVLVDGDQEAILKLQHEREQTFLKACDPGTVVLSDSSSLNAMLYMSSYQRKEVSKYHLPSEGLYFYCRPVSYGKAVDINRIHSLEEALEVDKELPTVLSTYFPQVKTVELQGDPETRSGIVLSWIQASLENASKTSTIGL